MDKIELGTPEGTAENIDKIAKLFPQVMTEVENGEGALERTVDFDALRDLLGDVAEGQRERYQFTWPGKREAKAEARRPIYKTMIPEPGKSKDWDTTENLYIEGDNLDALKILKETYAGKVKLIYIDPPYNTGHDFVYDDDFAKTRGEYDAESGEYDEEGGRLVANTESKGQFHSDWCTMMDPRLLLARDLLTADGAMFISIDDTELKNLRALCDELFGSSSFIADVIWKHTQQSKNDEPHFSRQYNHTLCYAKNKSALEPFYFERTEDDNKNYSNPDNDPNGAWRSGDVRSPNYRQTLRFDIVAPDGTVIAPPENGWRWSEASIQQKIATGEIKFKPDNSGIIRKIYLANQKGRTPENLWEGERFGTSRSAAAEIKRLFHGRQVFDTPKPKELVLRMLELLNMEDGLVLDFFGGSSSTAHAVMEHNIRNNAAVHWILVQIAEKCSEKSDARKYGFRDVTEIGEARIKAASAEYEKEAEETLGLMDGTQVDSHHDLGFRVLRIDSSNFKDFYLTPGETSQESLFDFADNVKEGRSDLDLLFEVLPKLGIPYSAKIEERMLAGRKVFFVDGDKLAACFDENVGSDTIEEMAKAKPWYAVIRDSSMADDATHANYEELFRTYSPDTVPQVI